MIRTSVKATAKAVEAKDKKVAEVFKTAQSTVDKMATKALFTKIKLPGLKAD